MQKALEDSIVAVVLKKAEVNDDVILRFFETTGNHVKAKVKFFKPIGQAMEVNLLENGDKEVDLSQIDVAPFEIRTVRMVLGQIEH